ncbi:cytochrome P450 4A6 [Culex quinquefasciatus]|uniref:Cytochrome P450 4A6 n=1 Tax=Culex quinquefasciatus TaxID=7176 RepID=B0X9M7_CULQU|nr:cytochrome P450 4A6 [Culex quinquefasciatus]|eukprot:XP_001866349.1 cytochrome P450 4A6 [Culex quinquefasciatus]
MIELFLVFFTCCSVAYYYLTFRRSRKRLYELAARIPGPFDWPIIGSLYLGVGVTKSRDIFEYMTQFLHKLELPARAWLGPFLVVAFDHPEHVAVVLNSTQCIRRSFMYRFFRFDRGLLMTPDPQHWKLLRKRLNSSFSPLVLKNFAPAFNECADKLVTSLDKYVDQGTFDLLPKVSEFTITATLLNLFKVDLRAGDNEFKEKFAVNAEKLWTLVWRRIYQPWLHLDFFYQFTDRFQEEKQRIRMIRDFTHEISNARDSTRINNNSQLPTQEDPPNAEVLIDRLERMAFDTQEIDQETFLSNIDTFMFASNDTTSNVMSTTLLMLAMHPEIQERVFAEVSQVTATSSFIPQEALSKLVYLEMVIKETMRLVPVGSILGRICEKELTVDQWTIPAGTEVVIPIFKMHRNKAVWGERSEEFDPDNFLPERCAQRHPYAYIPFSGGIRNCIGMKYAYMSLKIVLAKLIARYRFRTELKLEQLKFEPSLILLIVNKHMVRLERR